MIKEVKFTLELLADSEIVLIPGRAAPAVIKVATTGPQAGGQSTGCICFIGPGDDKELSFLYSPRDDAKYKVMQLVQKDGVSYVGLNDGLVFHLFQDKSKLPKDRQFHEVPFTDYLSILSFHMVR